MKRYSVELDEEFKALPLPRSHNEDSQEGEGDQQAEAKLEAKLDSKTASSKTKDDLSLKEIRECASGDVWETIVGLNSNSNTNWVGGDGCSTSVFS